MIHAQRFRFSGSGLFLLSLVLVVAIYWAGLQGSWLFADYPNLDAYQARGEARPAYRRALASQLADFEDRPAAA